MTVIEYDLEGVSGWHTWTDDHGEELPPGPLPATPYIVAAQAQLRRMLADLEAERGKAARVASRYGVGWDPERRAWVLPVFDGPFPVNVIWRPARGQSMRWRGGDVWRPRRIVGRTAARGLLPLYPAPPPPRSPWLLLAGEWDALAARGVNLPGVTGLLGCRWHDAWNPHVRGKRIAVCYDVGEERAAHMTVQRLRGAGAAEAWVVRLPLREQGDDVERALRHPACGGYGWTRGRLLEVIKKARRDAKK